MQSVKVVKVVKVLRVRVVVLLICHDGIWGLLYCCVRSARCGSSTRRMDAQRLHEAEASRCLTRQRIQVSAAGHGHQRLGDESAMERGIEASRAGKGSQLTASGLGESMHRRLCGR